MMSHTSAYLVFPSSPENSEVLFLVICQHDSDDVYTVSEEGRLVFEKVT
jgi:hypothetical protein